MLVSRYYNTTHWSHKRMFRHFGGIVSSRLQCLVPSSLRRFLCNHDALFGQIICYSAWNDIKRIFAHELVRSDVLNRWKYLFNRSTCPCIYLMFLICLNPRFLSGAFMFCGIHCAYKPGSAWSVERFVGRLNGYQCCCISTRASTSFHNGIDK